MTGSYASQAADLGVVAEHLLQLRHVPDGHHSQDAVDGVLRDAERAQLLRNL